MKLIEDVRLIIQICKLYYETDMSQKEISAFLKISRPQISRAIAFARQNGLVSIRINNPYSEESECERGLKELYGLRDALVVSTHGGGEDNMRDALAEQARMKMDYLLMRNSTVGVMSGKSIAMVMSRVSPKQRRVQKFVPLVGGFGPSGGEWQANIIARSVAERTGGTAYMLNAPLVVSDPSTRTRLESEPIIRSVLDMAQECGVMIVDIDEVEESATPVKYGEVSNEDVAELHKAGAIAAMGGSFFGEDGSLIKSDIAGRFIGISAQTLRACPNVVAVAFGERKTRAIAAALRSGYAHELITTMDTARRLLKNKS